MISFSGRGRQTSAHAQDDDLISFCARPKLFWKTARAILRIMMYFASVLWGFEWMMQFRACRAASIIRFLEY
eukprot:6501228-Pyramimonas_sp.AAC.1